MKKEQTNSTNSKLMGEPVTLAYHVENMQLRNAQLSVNRLRSLRVLSDVLLQRIISTKYIAPAQTEEDVHHIVRWSAAFFRPSKGRDGHTLQS